MRSFISAIFVLALLSCGPSAAIKGPPVLPTAASKVVVTTAVLSTEVIEPKGGEVATSALDEAAAADPAPVVATPVPADVKLPPGWKETERLTSENGSLVIKATSRALAATASIAVVRKDDVVKSPFSACNHYVLQYSGTSDRYDILHDNYQTDGTSCQTDMRSQKDRMSLMVQSVDGHRDLLIAVVINYPRAQSAAKMTKEITALAGKVTITP